MKRVLTIGFILINLLWLLCFPSAANGQTTIHIPDIGVAAPVVPVYIRQLAYGTTWDVTGLHMNTGLFDGLGTLGSATNTVIGAHSVATDGSPDLFFNLHLVQVGQAIVVDVAGQQMVYEVAQVYNVDQFDLSPIMPSTGERLTLITCARESFNSADGTYSQRVVVVAHRVR